MATDKWGNEVSPETWKAVDVAIKSFIRRYPLHWTHFREDIKRNRTQYQLANEGELKKAGFRNTLSFPVAYRRLTEEEKKENPEGSEIELLESLKDTIEKIIPGFTAPDENLGKADENKVTKKNMLYVEFVKRYSSILAPGEEQ